MQDELKTGDWREFLLWLVGRRQRFRVTGNSMLPLLKPGEEVLINPRAYRQQRPQPGDVVVAHHPDQPNMRLIKRVTALIGPDQVVLTGDNPAESTDSLSFGPVKDRQIVGQVTSRFG